jgi:type VI secretion system protein ImpC
MTQGEQEDEERARRAERKLTRAIAAIDALIAAQVAAIMHHSRFLALEGTWRGLAYLALLRTTNNSRQVRVLHVTKDELAADLGDNSFAETAIYHHVYEREFGTMGGEPYGVLVGDYAFSHAAGDVALLQGLAKLAATAFAPFIAAASPRLLALDDFERLEIRVDLHRIFAAPEYADWRALRESADARFVCLTLPRTRARAPYGAGTIVEAFDFQETDRDGAMPHADVCWMNTAYVLAARLLEAFAEDGWWTNIRGSTAGGRIDDLPGSADSMRYGEPAWPATETAIRDRRDAELAKLGLLALCSVRRTADAVFHGAPTLHKAAVLADPQASADAAIAARLPFVMAASRFAHYVKIMARDTLGSFRPPEWIEPWLGRWIAAHVDEAGNADGESDTTAPLRAARVRLAEVPGRPGAYQVILALRPWLGPEVLSADVDVAVALPGWG